MGPFQHKRLFALLTDATESVSQTGFGVLQLPALNLERAEKFETPLLELARETRTREGHMRGLPWLK